jgi:hypothetical protein
VIDPLVEVVAAACAVVRRSPCDTRCFVVDRPHGFVPEARAERLPERGRALDRR